MGKENDLTVGRTALRRSVESRCRCSNVHETVCRGLSETKAPRGFAGRAFALARLADRMTFANTFGSTNHSTVSAVAGEEKINFKSPVVQLKTAYFVNKIL